MSRVATVTMQQVCPMVTATVPHVGGPIVVGMPDCLIDGQPVATVGSMAVCIGPPATIAVGWPMFIVNGMPVAYVGSATNHGGVVTTGMPNCLV